MRCDTIPFHVPGGIEDFDVGWLIGFEVADGERGARGIGPCLRSWRGHSASNIDAAIKGRRVQFKRSTGR